MKNKDLFKLQNALNNVGRHTGAKFIYSVAKNLKMLESETQNILKAVAPSKEYQEYDKKRVEICMKHAEDDNGKPKFVDGNFIIKDRKKFDKEIEQLREEYKDVLKEHDKKVEEYKEFLEEESDYKPYQVSKDDLPPELTANELAGIFDLIKE